MLYIYFFLFALSPSSGRWKVKHCALTSIKASVAILWNRTAILTPAEWFVSKHLPKKYNTDLQLELLESRARSKRARERMENCAKHDSRWNLGRGSNNTTAREQRIGNRSWSDVLSDIAHSLANKQWKCFILFWYQWRNSFFLSNSGGVNVMWRLWHLWEPFL